MSNDQRAKELLAKYYPSLPTERQPIVPSDPDDPRFDGVVVERAASGGALSAEQREKLLQLAGDCWDRDWDVNQDCVDDFINYVNAALAAHDQKVRDEEREKVAAWMMENSFATGHGDSIEDLLKELKWQIEERIGKVREQVRTLAKRFRENEAENPWYGEAIAEAIEAALAPRTEEQP